MSRPRRQNPWDALFRGLTRAAAFGTLALFFTTLATLIVGAWPALRTFGFKFIWTAEWNPVAERFGALVPLIGTLVTSALALVIAVPVSFGIAVTLTELAPRSLRPPLAIAIELLAAVPSLIYGMWGLFVFAPAFAADVEPWVIDHLGPLPVIGRLFTGTPMGIGVFTAGLILAIMITPFISSVMRDVFLQTPAMLKESAYGLGATTWEVIWRVVVPHSKIGMVGGIILGLGRALGETMAVTFVIGNSHEWSTSLFMPGNTISSALANEFTEATGDLYAASLIALGLVLFLITFVTLGCAKLLLRGAERAS